MASIAVRISFTMVRDAPPIEKYTPDSKPNFIAQGGTMARNAARLKMGYYPLPESEAVRLRALLEFFRPGVGCRSLRRARNGA